MFLDYFLSYLFSIERCERNMHFFSKTLMITFSALGLGILLGLLLPVAFVAGVEAVIIMLIGVCHCFKRR